MAFLKDELQGFVPVQQSGEILKEVVKGSSVLRLSKVEPMTSETKQFSIMTDGPGAFWVGETERIQTSTAEWIFPEMKAKKLAVIVPVSKEKLNDTTIDVFNEMKSAISEAFYNAIDSACLFGTNSPFAKSVYSAAGENKIAVGTEKSLDLDVSEVMGLVEDAGQDINGFIAHYGMKKEIRNLRDANGNQLFVPGMNQNEFYSNPIEFSRNGAWDKTKAEMLAGNWNYSLVGMREGIEYEILKEATLQSVTMSDGKPLSLSENDMVAIKATMRLGYLPIKDEAFAILEPKVAVQSVETFSSDKELKDLTVTELKVIAKSKEIDGYSSMNKETLISAIEAEIISKFEAKQEDNQTGEGSEE